MDRKSRCINYLRETLEKKELFSSSTAISMFCGQVLGYRERRYHMERETIGGVITLKMNLKNTARPKVKSEEIVDCLECNHYFNNSATEYDNSGMLVQIKFSGPLVSLAQIIRLRKSGLHVDDIKWLAYGKEWEGMEIPTGECFQEELGIKAPKLKPLSIEEIIEQYERRNGSVAIPVE